MDPKKNQPWIKRILLAIGLVFLPLYLFCGENIQRGEINPRERILMDSAWLFSFGHPFDASIDFNTGTGYFSYFAKTGCGDPTSHEPDRFFKSVKAIKIENLKELAVDHLSNRPEVALRFNDAAWKPAFVSSRYDNWRVYKDTLMVVRGTIILPGLKPAFIKIRTN